ncbi:hypothetical protein E2C01_050670 [Portunus trituberculatus]|uniref:Uncharacterized protein n=1 Tax=Portunus trituberculatus TaxID=210409 RepID=A0A5B7GH05_PORTR|nr:hypothetical protein [Portunus trituberculatus]
MPTGHPFFREGSAGRDAEDSRNPKSPKVLVSVQLVLHHPTHLPSLHLYTSPPPPPPPPPPITTTTITTSYLSHAYLRQTKESSECPIEGVLTKKRGMLSSHLSHQWLGAMPLTPAFNPQYSSYNSLHTGLVRESRIWVEEESRRVCVSSLQHNSFHHYHHIHTCLAHLLHPHRSRSPISAIQSVFECAVVLLGSADVSWRAVRHATQDDNFCVRLAAVCVPALTQAVVSTLADKLEVIIIPLIVN